MRSGFICAHAINIGQRRIMMDLVEGMMANKTMMSLMTFHFSRIVPQGLLFSSWRVQSTGDLVGAIVAVFILAILYEGLKTLREYLVFMDWKHSKPRREVNSPQSSDSGDEDVGSTNEQSFIFTRKTKRNRFLKKKGFKYYTISVSMHLLQSVLHVVQVGYAYLLMLVIMTYNGWLFLSVSIGAGVGYLMFAQSRHLMGNFREQNEHCH